MRRRKRRQRAKTTALVVSTVALWAAVGVLMIRSLDHPGEQHVSGADYVAEIAQHAPAEPVPVVAQPEVAEPVELARLYDVPLDADLQQYVVEQAEAYGIDPAVVFAMAWRESRYHADAVGDDGKALGLLQIWPYWHSGRMERLGCTDLLDPYQNAAVGIDYLAECIERYDGDVAKGLTAYNCGSYSGTITDYALSVLDMACELRGERDA